MEGDPKSVLFDQCKREARRIVLEECQHEARRSAEVPPVPILFNLFVEELAERLRKREFGAKINGIDLYADEVVLLAESATDLQGMIDVVDKFCRQWRMEINLKKSEVVVVRTE